MTNPNDPAFAHDGAVVANKQNTEVPFLDKIIAIKQKHEGLTKREYFAAMAMQGLVANPNFFGPTYQQSPLGAAQFGVEAADALVAELNKENGSPTGDTVDAFSPDREAR